MLVLAPGSILFLELVSAHLEPSFAVFVIVSHHARDEAEEEFIVLLARRRGEPKHLLRPVGDVTIDHLFVLILDTVCLAILSWWEQGLRVVCGGSRIQDRVDETTA